MNSTSLLLYYWTFSCVARKLCGFKSSYGSMTDIYLTLNNGNTKIQEGEDKKLRRKVKHVGSQSLKLLETFMEWKKNVHKMGTGLQHIHTHTHT